jgi:hypothetical protein
MRKVFFAPTAQFQFYRINPFEGHNYGLPPRKVDREPYLKFDKDGNALPTNVRRYPFADEYTYRI